jgi:hypothetical protein
MIKTLSPAMLRELQSIARWGEPSGLEHWHGCGALWFHARERVLSALIRRGLIADAETITDAGRAAIAAAECQS